MLATRIALFLITVSLALPAWSQGTFVYQQDAQQGRNNITDSSAQGACGFILTHGLDPNDPNQDTWTLGTCRDVNGATCPIGTICTVQRVPQGRCSLGLNAACIWPQGAGFCTADPNQACLTHLDCAGVGGTCNLSTNNPACTCQGLDATQPDFETNASVCSGRVGVCSDGDVNAVRGEFGGTLCTDVNITSPAITNCGRAAGQQFTGPRYGEENPPIGPMAFRKPGTGASVGTPIRDLTGDGGTIIGAIDPVTGTRSLKTPGENVLTIWAWGDKTITGGAVSAAIVGHYCKMATGFQTNLPANGQCLANTSIFCIQDTDCPGADTCNKTNFCHQNPTRIVGTIWTRDLNPADPNLLPPNLDVDANGKPDCPPLCGKDIIYNTLNEQAIINLGNLDPDAGVQAVYDIAAGDPAGAGDYIVTLDLFVSTFLTETPPECYTGGDPETIGASCAGSPPDPNVPGQLVCGTGTSRCLVANNDANGNTDCRKKIGRCSGSATACDPGDPSSTTFADCPPSEVCVACYGPYNAANSGPAGPNVYSFDSTGNDLALPVAYNTLGLGQLEVHTDCSGNGGIPANCSRVGDVTGRAGLPSTVITPLFVIATTGHVANYVLDPKVFDPNAPTDPNNASADNANLGFAPGGIPGLGTGGTYTNGTNFPGGGSCCDNGNSGADISWTPDNPGTIQNTTILSDWGPGANRVPGCFGDSSTSSLFDGVDAGPCNDPLGFDNSPGRANVPPGSDVNTGADDVRRLHTFTQLTPGATCQTDVLINGPGTAGSDGVVDSFASSVAPSGSFTACTSNANCGAGEACSNTLPSLFPRGNVPNPSAVAPTTYTVAAISGYDTTVILDKSTDFLFKSDDINCPVDANGDRQCVCPLFAGCGGPDTDGDGLEDARDTCPTVVNSAVDADGDGVDDACDTCVGLFNPAFYGTTSPGGGLAINAALTLTSLQRDDDGDGYGNRCDFKYSGNAGTFISPIDVADMRNSTAKLIFGSNCGQTLAKGCAQFDHDEAGVVVAPADVAALRARVATLNGPKCGGTACNPPFSVSNLGSLTVINVGQAVQCGAAVGTTCP